MRLCSTCDWVSKTCPWTGCPMRLCSTCNWVSETCPRTGCLMRLPGLGVQILFVVFPVRIVFSASYIRHRCPNLFRTGCPFFEPNRLLDFVSTRTWCPHRSHDFICLRLGVHIGSSPVCVPDLVPSSASRLSTRGLGVRTVSTTLSVYPNC